jgi:hypothetical protein
MKICHFAATKGIGRGEAFVEVANEMSEHITTHLLFPKGALFIGNISRAVNCHQYYNQGSRNNIFLLIEIYLYLRREKFDLITTQNISSTFKAFKNSAHCGEAQPKTLQDLQQS